jgi:hypothetical protein
MHSNPTLSMVENTLKVLSWCHENNYKPWYVAEAVEITDPEQLKHRDRCHLLLQPVSWDYPEWLKGIKESSLVEPIISSLNNNSPAHP